MNGSNLAGGLLKGALPFLRCSDQYNHVKDWMITSIARLKS